MPYVRQECKAGKTKEVIFYYSPKWNNKVKEGNRQKKQNKTKEAQRAVNRRQAERKLTRIFNANFDNTSLYITYEYKKENRPTTKEEIIKDVEKLLRELRKIYKKRGKVLKYVWVVEVGVRGAAHIHMVVNVMELAEIKKTWDKGWITIKPLDDSGQYRRLANYFIKYSDKTMKTVEGFTGRRYNGSKNLIIPIPEKKVVTGRKDYNHKITVPAGWYVDKDSIREAWHEVTGYMYFAYTLIYNGIKPKKEDIGIHTYTLDLETGEVEITEHVKDINKNKTHKRKAGQG